MNKRAGFSLVELIIVVALISILAVIALPSYTSYVLEARRADAQQMLLDIALRQSLWRANNPTYATYADLGEPDIPYYNDPVVSGISATGFTLSATAKTSQASDSEGSTSCTPLTYTLSSTTVTKGPAGCWD